MSGAGRPAARVVVVGTLNVDLVWQVPALPRPGQTIVADKVERQFGGKGANQAVAAARQGARVTLVGAVGDDADGRAYREHLQQEGINVGAITTVPGVATGTAHVYVDPRGENLIVVDRGANAHLELAPLADLLDASDALVLQLECALPVAVEALRLAAAIGIRSILNASPPHPDFPWGRHVIDTVIVNEHECVDCFQRSPAELAALSDQARQDFLRERRMSHLVITQGADVTLLLATTAVWRVPTYPVTPRDTVGAGDTFAGALADQLAAGFVWERALRHANIAAALSTLAIGAQAAMPTRAAVEAAKG
jgi:ribokinase